MVIANHHGMRATPTLVAFTDSEVLVGEAALTQMSKNRANTVFGFKWMIGGAGMDGEMVKRVMSKAPFEVVKDARGCPRFCVLHKGEQKQLSPEYLCGQLFEHLKSIAEQFVGETVGKCVVAVPADFTDAQRRAVETCGQAANLPISLMLKDPIAVAIAYGLDRTDEQLLSSGRDDAHAHAHTTILVVDWGGGGLETTLLNRANGMLSLAGMTRNPGVGGGEFVQRLVDMCAKSFKQSCGADVNESARAVMKLTRACEDAMRTLSVSQQAELYVEALYEGIDFKTQVTRTKFEALCGDLFNSAREAIRAAIPADRVIDMVLLSGGVAHMPRVQSLVRGILPDVVYGTGLFPDEAIAIGCAIQASLLQETPKPTGGAPLPRKFATSPIALGLSSSLECPAAASPSASPEDEDAGDDDRDDEGSCILLPFGSLLPAQRATSMHAMTTEQGELMLYVLQLWGDSKSPTAIGCLKFETLPQGKRLKLNVGVTVRSDGLVKVEVMDSASRRTQHVTIERDAMEGLAGQ
jgi:heat shock protein 1/8